MKILATMGCIQGRGWRCIEFFADKISHILLALFALISLLFAALGLLLLFRQKSGADVIGTFILSKIYSFAYWFFYTGPLFAFKLRSNQIKSLSLSLYTSFGLIDTPLTEPNSWSSTWTSLRRRRRGSTADSPSS